MCASSHYGPFFLLPAGDGTTKVELSHSDIPDFDAHGNGDQKVSAERGWRERIFGAIQRVCPQKMHEFAGVGLGV